MTSQIILYYALTPLSSAFTVGAISNLFRAIYARLMARLNADINHEFFTQRIERQWGEPKRHLPSASDTKADGRVQRQSCERSWTSYRVLVEEA